MDEQESDEKIPMLKEASKKAIKDLLSLAYEGLKEPTYIGYPTSDLIACFLDAKKALRSEFQNMFDDAVPDYREWKQFREDKVEPLLDKILDELTTLKRGQRADFDSWSRDHKLIANYAVASSFFTLFYYIRINRAWMDSTRNDKLKKCTQDFLRKRISKKGWQYLHSDKGKFSGIMPTWLSILALDYIPKDIVEEMKLNTEIKTIKTEVGKWLINSENMHKDDENRYCSWSFQPERSKEYNPTATAQAISALRILKMKDTEKIVDYAVGYVKDNWDKISDTAEKEIYLETKIRSSGGSSTSKINFPHPGIQQCLQVLLTSSVSREDDTILNLIEKNLVKTDEMVEHKRKFDEVKLREEKMAVIDDARDAFEYDSYDIYPTLLPFLYYLYPPMEPILLDSSDFKSEFESFISKAENSIILIGEIDTAYVKVLEELSKNREIKVKVYHPPKQDKLLIQYRDWNLIETDWRFENLHCAIVDKNEGLFSSEPFRETDSYNIIKRLNDEEVSNLINQLNEVIGVKPEEEIKEIVGKKFPEQSKIMTLEDLESNQLEGILEYYKPNPKYSEAVPSSLGFAGGEKRENIEVGFTSRGIISRVFMNSELESLINNEIKDENLVMDESSAYLLLQSDKIEEIEENIKFLLRRPGPVKGELYVLSKVHDRLDKLMKDLESKERYKGRVRNIGDKTIDAEIESERYYLSKNERILITFTKKEKYGLITNTWEVAKRCMELGINVYSLVKILDKNEKTYKMFRIPIDLLREE